jgi:nucleoside-diphosphate-sugar epimerase
MDLWGELIGLPILQQGKAMIFGSGNNPINFVAVQDVADLTCAAAAAIQELPRPLTRFEDWARDRYRSQAAEQQAAIV